MSVGKMPRDEDGQHYSKDFYNPGMESGQKSSINPSARVGNVSGGEQNMSVPKPGRCDDISTTTK